MACAQQVRACIIAAVPAPDGVIPDDAGSAAGAHDAGMPDDLPEPPVDAGAPSDPGAAGLPDAGTVGDAPAAASCIDQFEACVAAGGAPRSCGMQLKECGRGAAP